MTTVEAALAAMDAAEQEARSLPALIVWEGRWARDRLRLIARDRATLERHTPKRCAFCNARAIHGFALGVPRPESRRRLLAGGRMSDLTRIRKWPNTCDEEAADA